MCDKHATPAPAASSVSSRRRRLWELSHTCHCPLIGVGLSLSGLRKLADKIAGERLLYDDYDIHVAAVNECVARSPMSDALQKELERRYAPEVARFHAARTAAQVRALWDGAVAEGKVAGAFWAGLSHPRCDAALEEQMCRDIHMVQHQAGACVRADIHKFQALQADHARLQQECTRLQARGLSLAQEKALQTQQHEAALLHLRTQLIARASACAELRSELAALRAGVPELESRERLAAQLAQAQLREQALRAQLAESKAAAMALPEARPAVRVVTEEVLTYMVPTRLTLANRSVLCVGGRSGNIAHYRSIIEKVGAQFAHHDGGLEDSSSQLDAHLAAADLVICQTGCISHGAYWRVKDHCKRTGKRCVYVDNPSSASLTRSLQSIDAEL